MDKCGQGHTVDKCGQGHTMDKCRHGHTMYTSVDKIKHTVDKCGDCHTVNKCYQSLSVILSQFTRGQVRIRCTSVDTFTWIAGGVCIITNLCAYQRAYIVCVCL